jgi:hypothetical protein
MALKINIEEQTKDVTYFGDIRRGDFFLFNGKVFVKLEEFFIVDEIITELEYEHDFRHEDDINSDRYNCWLVGSECDFRNLENMTIVDRIDVDMNVRYVK